MNESSGAAALFCCAYFHSQFVSWAYDILEGLENVATIKEIRRLYEKGIRENSFLKEGGNEDEE